MKTISKRQVPKNWLLIGGAGYIGSHTLRELQKKGSEVIVLDNDDNVIGHANKKVTHIFNKENPISRFHKEFPTEI